PIIPAGRTRNPTASARRCSCAPSRQSGPATRSPTTTATTISATSSPAAVANATSAGRGGPRRGGRSARRRRARRGGTCGRARLAVELLEVAINAPLAERDAALGGKIGSNARTLGDTVMQRDQPRHLPLEPLHA